MSNNKSERVSTGIAELDQHLGGGLLPGTLTVILGATGIGKTQLSVSFAHEGKAAEGREGFLVDLASRGDSQNHAGYADRIADWQLDSTAIALEHVLQLDTPCGNYLRMFEAQATRVTKRDLSFDQWHDWQAQTNRRLRDALSFVVGNFVRGSRRVVFDGFEPADHPAQSVQFNLFEYLYHSAIREESEWVARELFREKFRENLDLIRQHQYDSQKVTCLAMCTSKEQMLEDLITRPLDEGDIISNANTLILMGRTRESTKMGRAFYIAKHRGSGCSEEIIPFTINNAGIQVG